MSFKHPMKTLLSTLRVMGPTWSTAFWIVGLIYGYAGMRETDLRAAADALGCELPTELTTMLRAVNGIYDRDAQWQTGWPLHRITSDTVSLWSIGFPPTMIAIGDDGTGHPFCVRSNTTDVTNPVFHWSSIDTELSLMAPSLRTFWPGWLTGHLTT